MGRQPNMAAGDAPSCPSLPSRRPLPRSSSFEGTILVVDDDALISMSTVAMLEDLGHKVIEANSGHQALEILGNDCASIS